MINRRLTEPKIIYHADIFDQSLLHIGAQSKGLTEPKIIDHTDILDHRIS
jgi:hypothetical protein